MVFGWPLANLDRGLSNHLDSGDTPLNVPCAILESLTNCNDERGGPSCVSHPHDPENVDVWPSL